jgi:hypothetical protein
MSSSELEDAESFSVEERPIEIPEYLVRGTTQSAAVSAGSAISFVEGFYSQQKVCPLLQLR